MAIFLLACKEMQTKMKKLLIWMVPLHFELHQLISPLVPFNENLIVGNNILAFFCRPIKFYFITVYIEVCVLKPL